MTGPDDRLGADDPGPGTGADAGIDQGGAAVADGAIPDALFDRLLAGGVPEADDPAWSRDLVRLVLAVQAPARPDELSGQHEIVGRMIEVRRAAREELVPAGAPTADAAVVRLLPARRPDEPWPGPRRRGPHVGVYHAKHAAARLEASRHPAVRNLGRVLAVKAAAVTTAVVVGTVAAAAAATTGLVATVVVPALTSDDPAPSEPAPSPELDEGDGGRVGTAATNDDSLARRVTPPVPSTDCGGDPGDPGCAVQPAPATASSTVPSTTATTSPDDPATTPEATTTTTTAPPPTTAPPATTVPEPPSTTTTTVPEDPPPTTPLSDVGTVGRAPGDRGDHRLVHHPSSTP
jgi:hypothetical protein